MFGSEQGIELLTIAWSELTYEIAFQHYLRRLSRSKMLNETIFKLKKISSGTGHACVGCTSDKHVCVLWSFIQP